MLDTKPYKSEDERRHEQWQAILARPPVPLEKIRKRVAIISLPRSGSTLFCTTLRDTGRLGDPDEWFNKKVRQVFAGIKGEDLLNSPEYLSLIQQQTSTKNGVFSVNFHVSDYYEMRRQGVELFKHFKFDHIYYVYRRDKLAQAWSMAKANATGVWTSTIERPGNYAELVAGISDADIVNWLRILTNHHEVYEQRINRLVNREFCYEDYSSDPHATCYKQVCADVGIELPDGHEFSSPLSRQSGSKDDSRLSALKNFIFGDQ